MIIPNIWIKMFQTTKQFYCYYHRQDVIFIPGLPQTRHTSLCGAVCRAKLREASPIDQEAGKC